MKRICFFWLAALFVAAMSTGFVACGGGGDDGDEPTPVNPVNPENSDNPENPGNPSNPGTPTGPYCKASFGDIVVLSKNELGPQIFLNTNIPLKNISLSVEPGGEWLRPDINDFESGEYNRTINLRNDGYDSRNENGDKIYEHYRTAVLRVKAGSVFDKRVTIIQEGNINLNTYVQLYQSGVLYMNPAGETKEVKVVANCYSWTPTTEADWVTLTKKDNHILIVTTAPRAADSDKKRVATISITNDKVEWQKDETLFKVADGEPNISGENFNYGDEISEWD